MKRERFFLRQQATIQNSNQSWSQRKKGVFHIVKTRRKIIPKFNRQRVLHILSHWCFWRPNNGSCGMRDISIDNISHTHSHGVIHNQTIFFTQEKIHFWKKKSPPIDMTFGKKGIFIATNNRNIVAYYSPSWLNRYPCFAVIRQNQNVSFYLLIQLHSC